MTQAAPEWIQGLADETLKTDPSIQSFQSVEDLAKGFISTKALVGKKGVILPAEGAKEEEWNPVYEALGRPKTPDDYKMPADLKLEKDMALDEEDLKAFRVYAHSIGMPQKQFEKVISYRINKQMADHKAGKTAAEQRAQATETALRKTWGAAYDERTAGVQGLLKTFGGERGAAFVEKYGKDPDVIAVLGEILPHLSEASIGQIGFKAGGSMTPDEAKAEIARIRGDEKHPHNIENHPEHKKAIEDMSKLYALAHPDKRRV